MTARLPVTVLSGFPGAGKTTLRRYLRTHDEGLRIAVIVNDMNAPDNAADSGASTADDCMVCLSRNDLLAALSRIANEGRFDAVIIESAGFSDPMGMAEALIGGSAGDDDDAPPLSSVVRLDNLVTVIDAWNFYRDYFSRDTVALRSGSAHDDHRAVVDVLVAQVEFANVIVLNKCDQVNDQQRGILLGILRALNPGAAVIESTGGRVPPATLMNTGRFDFNATGRAAGWMQAMRSSPVPETPAFGIRSFAWHARRPMHPMRFAQLIHEKWRGILRSKGFFWLASRNAHVGEWEQAGAINRIRSGGHWWCFTGRESWPTDEGHLAHIRSRWEEPCGDCRQEWVFIGMGVDESALKGRLEACLLTDDEMALGEQAWAGLPDPMPGWHDDHPPHHDGEHHGTVPR